MHIISVQAKDFRNIEERFIALNPQVTSIVGDNEVGKTNTLLAIMEKLNREENITFIFSTHDARVMNKARRVITVEDGQVVADKIN